MAKENVFDKIIEDSKKRKEKGADDYTEVLSHGILVRKDGIYYRYWEDSKQNENKIDSFLPYLREEIQFVDITFEDFFNHIMKDHEEYSKVFASHLGHYELDIWLGEWSMDDSDPQHVHERMKQIEIGWAADKNENEINEWVQFHGWGQSFDKYSKQVGDGKWEGEWHDTHFALEYSPLNTLKHYPFLINKEYKIYEFCSAEKPLLEGYKSFTVFDVISAILFEISFAGSPTNRTERMEEMNATIERIESGEEETTSYDSVEEMLDDLKKDDE